MDESIDKKPELKENLRIIFNRNKKKIILILTLIAIIPVAILMWNVNQNKKNLIISEKYIEAGLLLSKGNKQEAKILFEEIILSNNQFYSILALNSVLEKKLITDKEKILDYFQILEKKITNKKNIDLILFKKALFLIKEKDTEEGKIILERLVEKNSNLKTLSQEIIEK